ncbi:hypothetical protein [Paenibacillus macquariensis]|uniref:Phage-related protein n=1 Tax=Paenibacillus macquariensis TaxID=948756 RepID=A0ABY1KET1_9BACL|nr:hypothetical protein [Paenibacillus macquariensis]MEC0092481.1 hypothetical protein [Paenibacillus macquariensis]OAB35439.1 hypothetical protein PMSM_09285 [Paenibacillus macquariensis subsp. macquariensis]SIR72604.1 hypothetical protein SAMN05421578_1484 [Paenibacillus macquariensis]
MIKTALQYLIGLGNQETMEINGQKFSNQPLNLLRKPTPSALTVRSLSGFVDYLKSNYDSPGSLMVHVESPTKVSAFSSFNEDLARHNYIEAEALLPSIRFGNWTDVEEFNIMLQSLFVPNEDRASLLKVVGNVKEDAVQNISDDGISQQVTAKTGVATVSAVTVPNPVTLFPYRTFVEVQQPESLFVFRMKTGPAAALFEADGGAWKVEAMDTIRGYLQEQLKEEIESGKIVLIA